MRLINKYRLILLITIIILISSLIGAYYIIPMSKFNVDITNFKEINIPNNKRNREYAYDKLETEFSVFYKRMILSKDKSRIILEPITDSKELNELTYSFNTLSEFNDYISKIQYDTSPIFNSPVLKEGENRMNCYGLTLLTMSYLKNNYDEQYYYKIIEDRQTPHIYLHLFDKHNNEFIKKIDLTLNNNLNI